MLTNILKRTVNAIHDQNFEVAYILQAVPVLGMGISAPVALIAGAMAIAKCVQSLFQKLKDGTPFFRSPDDTHFYMNKPPLQDAIDLGVIFTNNVLNICTFGILNNIFVWHALSSIRCGGED